MDICQIGYDICEFDSLRGLGIDVIGRVHFDNRDRFAIWMGSIGDRTMSTNEWLLTSDFWQFLEPWHGRWCEYEIFIASCTDNIYDLENERWLLGTWLIMLGFMDLGWPRVYRRSTSVLYILNWGPGHCLSVKMPYQPYRKTHYIDKTASPTSYLYNGNPSTW